MYENGIIWALAMIGLLFFSIFIRTIVCLGIVKPLRSVIGLSGNLILSLCITLFVAQFSEFENSLTVQEFTVTEFFKEAVVGVIFGITISLLFEIFPFVGRMIDTFRGNQFSEQIAPELGVRDSVLEIYASLAMPAIFFNGPYYLKFIEIYSSYQYTKLSGKALLDDYFLNSNFVFLMSNAVLEIAVILIFPLILVALSLEISLAVFQKLYSRFQVGIELGLLRTGFGIIFLLLLVRFNQPLFYLDKFLMLLIGQG